MRQLFDLGEVAGKTVKSATILTDRYCDDIALFIFTDDTFVAIDSYEGSRDVGVLEDALSDKDKHKVGIISDAEWQAFLDEERRIQEAEERKEQEQKERWAREAEEREHQEYLRLKAKFESK